MSFALYLRYDEADFTEYITSFSVAADAREAKLKIEQDMWDSAEDGDDIPHVVLVEEPDGS